MSADLRRAAALMRERANRAAPGRWYPSDQPESMWDVESVSDAEPAGIAVAAATAQTGACVQEDAEHIASWHPAVALAVADLLDAEAARVERDNAHLVSQHGEDGGGVVHVAPSAHCAYLARAYLGESA
jgi:hypothetical protein